VDRIADPWGSADAVRPGYPVAGAGGRVRRGRTRAVGTGRVRPALQRRRDGHRGTGRPDRRRPRPGRRPG